MSSGPDLMPIEGVDLATMKKAIQAYLEIAWGEQAAKHQPAIDFESCQQIEDALKSFSPDKRVGKMRKYSLRLGNHRYPFMKLVFQELLIRDRFFFAVDTHDELELRDSFPDYEEWLELKRFNHRLKERIERIWQAEGVPTFADLVAQVERETPPGPRAPTQPTAPLVLIVDDDANIAQGVHTILSRHGYRTRQVHSAEEAQEAIRAEPPQLILSDLEMGGKSGLELATELRQEESTASIPFILASAASVASTNFRVIDGFLVKPYEAAVLLRFVSQHLAQAGKSGSIPDRGGGAKP